MAAETKPAWKRTHNGRHHARWVAPRGNAFWIDLWSEHVEIAYSPRIWHPKRWQKGFDPNLVQLVRNFLRCDYDDYSALPPVIDRLTEIGCPDAFVDLLREVL